MCYSINAKHAYCVMFHETISLIT